ncbi:MAG: sigma-54-dependent Fis family transcriptional regulator [Planctomycetota bacterium]|nr:MAG: sigma-54-dependent Fis family transcriptional regulator [Planctomycetota bacterium]
MKILIVDDEKRFAKVLQLALNTEGYDRVEIACSGDEAIEKIRISPYDLVVTDLRMPGMNGLELMAEVKRRTPGTDIILMTAFADVETARAALKKGALDYLVKPFDNSELISLVSQSASRRIVNGTGMAAEKTDALFAGMVGRSKAMKSVFERITKAAHSEAAVLILGESGTGKELVARAVHKLSNRHKGPFVDLHCAAIPENLLESELFGHEKGAFTGADNQKKGRLELAAGGVIFLDEIGEMPLSLQPKLLRFLQEHQLVRVGGSDTINVDARVVAATNRDLESEVKNGNFREDLYYRLDVINIMIPPLAERKEDIVPLIRYFLQLKGSSPETINDEVLEILRQYKWPGNVRELQNVIERAIIESDGEVVEPGHLPERLVVNNEDRPEGGTLDHTTSERQLIMQALTKAKGNKSEAARLLGITRRKLYSRLKRLDIDLNQI